MKLSWKMLAAMMCYTFGVIGWCYVGGWMILTKPVKGLILAHVAGNLSLGMLVTAFVQGFIYLSLAGAVWCVGYMLARHFRDKR